MDSVLGEVTLYRLSFFKQESTRYASRFPAVCDVPPASHFSHLTHFFNQGNLETFFWKNTLVYFVFFLFDLKVRLTLCSHHILPLNKEMPCLKAFSQWLLMRKNAIYVHVHWETNILVIGQLTVAVRLDTIQSNGSFLCKQKMIYSLPGGQESHSSTASLW